MKLQCTVLGAHAEKAEHVRRRGRVAFFHPSRVPETHWETVVPGSDETSPRGFSSNIREMCVNSSRGSRAGDQAQLCSPIPVILNNGAGNHQMHFCRFLNNADVPFLLQYWKVHSSKSHIHCTVNYPNVLQSLYSPKLCNLVSHGGSGRSWISQSKNIAVL